MQSSTAGDQQYWPTPSLNGITTDWSTISATFTVNGAVYDKITYNIGDFEGTIEMDDVVLTKTGSDENLIANGTFEISDLKYHPAGTVQVTDKLVQWSRGVASEWFEVAAK